MSNAVLEVFDASLQKTQVWLNDLMSELGKKSHRKPAWLYVRRCMPCATG